MPEGEDRRNQIREPNQGRIHLGVSESAIEIFMIVSPGHDNKKPKNLT
jgi:hypothetical protein